MPHHWKTYKLGDVAEVTSGFAFKSKDMGDVGYPIIKIKNINPPFVDVNDSQRIPASIISESSRVQRFLLKEGDILIAMTGATVGKVGRVPELTEPCYLNQRVGKVFPKSEDSIDYDFLYYILSQRDYVEQMFGLADGSAQANVSGKQIEGLEIYLPPLPEQRAIASILSALDDKIENNLAMNRTLEDMAMALYKHWFVDFGPFQDGNFIDSELGPIPEGWQVSTIGNIAEIVDCLHSKKPKELAEGKLLLQVFNIGRNSEIDLSKKYFVSDADYETWTKRIEVFDGDLIISKNGRVGAIAEIPYGFKAAMGRNMLAIRATEVSKPFLRDLMLSKSMRREIESRTNSGTILSSLHVKETARLEFILPSENAVAAYSELVFPIHLKKQKNSSENLVLTKLRDTLLPKLISGEVRLKEFEKEISEAL